MPGVVTISVIQRTSELREILAGNDRQRQNKNARANNLQTGEML
jgi:hypothetical protein